MLRYCYRCFAELAGWRANDRRLKERVTVQLVDGRRNVSLAEWAPDVAISRERQKSEAQR
ncbi:MAG: hypothetical protein NUW22_12390 [Acidobacteria bacterium]|nr:hypothetical protein [Acidobacteriota bacterium]